MSWKKRLRRVPVIGSLGYFFAIASKKQLFNPVVAVNTARYLPKYYSHLSALKRMAKEQGVKLDFKRMFPVYVNYSKPTVNRHYWFQDIYAATKIIDASRTTPDFHHIDIGSRVEGFITSLISARVPLTFGDINVPAVEFPNTDARFIDLQKMTPEQFTKAKSVSCLHVIEHLGLGRYGDAVDPLGHRRIFADFGSVLRPGTKLYISGPISNDPGIYFDSSRHMNPREMLADAKNAGFKIDEIGLVQDDWSLIVNPTEAQIEAPEYGCLILCLEKE